MKYQFNLNHTMLHCPNYNVTKTQKMLINVSKTQI